MGVGAVGVVQDEETGAWYQHRGRDFKVPLVDYLQEGGNIVGRKNGFGKWPACRTHDVFFYASSFLYA